MTTPTPMTTTNAEPRPIVTHDCSLCGTDGMFPLTTADLPHDSATVTKRCPACGYWTVFFRSDGETRGKPYATAEDIENVIEDGDYAAYGLVDYAFNVTHKLREVKGESCIAYSVRWQGGATPSGLVLDGQRVGYMRDGIVMSIDHGHMGTYTRLSDMRRGDAAHKVVITMPHESPVPQRAIHIGAPIHSSGGARWTVAGLTAEGYWRLEGVPGPGRGNDFRIHPDDLFWDLVAKRWAPREEQRFGLPEGIIGFFRRAVTWPGDGESVTTSEGIVNLTEAIAKRMLVFARRAGSTFDGSTLDVIHHFLHLPDDAFNPMSEIRRCWQDGSLARAVRLVHQRFDTPTE